MYEKVGALKVQRNGKQNGSQQTIVNETLGNEAFIRARDLYANIRKIARKSFPFPILSQRHDGIL